MEKTQAEPEYVEIPVSFWRTRGVTIDWNNSSAYIAETCSASAYVKNKGFKSLVQVSKRIYVSTGRLNRMYKYEPKMFDAIIDGLLSQEYI